MATQVYDDFSGGDWGDLLDAGSAPPKTFSATNMLVYETGLLGARPGGMPVGTLPTGRPRGLALSHLRLGGGGGIAGVVVMDTGLCYRFDSADGSGMTVFGGEHPTATGRTVGMWPDPGTDDVYVAVPGQGILKLNVVTLVGDMLAASPDCRVVARAGVRLVAAGGAGAGEANRLHFSDQGEPETWGALSYEVVGDASPITAIFESRSALMVGKQTGWIAVQGLGSDTPRATPVTQQPGPTVSSAVDRAGSEAIGYVAADGSPVASIFDGSTASKVVGRRFAYGTNVNPNPPSEFPANDPFISVVRAGRAGLLYASRGRDEDSTTVAWLFDGARWTRHTFSGQFGYWMAPQFQQVFPLIAEGDYPQDYVWASDARAQPSPLTKFRVGNVVRPGQAGSMILGRPSVGTVRFPDVRAPRGEQVRVKQVTLDIDRWNNGATDDRSIALTIGVLGRWESQNTVVPQSTGGYVEAMSAPTGPHTHVQNVRSGWGQGFYIALDGFYGCALRRMLVEYETSGALGGVERD